MMRAPMCGAFLREMLASAVAQRVFTAVTVIIIAGATTTTLLTSGRSAAAEAAVLRTIDAQNTRTITIQAKKPHPDFSSALVDQIAQLPEVESVVGFGPVSDATAAAIPDGTRVGLRTAYGYLGGKAMRQPETSVVGTQVWASRASTDALGLPPGSGSIRVVDGQEFQVTAEFHAPAFLSPLQPLIVIPSNRSALTEPIPLNSIVVLSRTPESVALITDLARRQIADIPRDSITLSTSEQMAALRAAIGGELTRQGRMVLLGVLGAAAAATFINVWGFVLMRRKDFGRRRALGATRVTIVVLIVGQVFLTAAVAAPIGAAAGLAWLIAEGSLLPAAAYVCAVITALTLTAVVAAALPAAIAARRDPIHELRVP